jgi:hypothetical protein
MELEFGFGRPHTGLYSAGAGQWNRNVKVWNCTEEKVILSYVHFFLIYLQQGCVNFPQFCYTSSYVSAD